MKKLLFAFSALALIFTSCSSDDSSTPTPTNTVLLKRMVETDELGDVYTSTFNYNGTKLVSITTDNGFVEEFTYTGDLITKWEQSYDGVLDAQYLYEYDSQGRLASYSLTHPDSSSLNRKEVYTYNADGTISFAIYEGGAPWVLSDATGKIFLTDGMISKDELYDSTGGTSLSEIYTYDSANNPYKNITGFDKIAFTDGIMASTMHNMLTNDHLFYGTTEHSDTYTYTYNTSNYPVTGTETDENGDVITTQYFYE